MLDPDWRSAHSTLSLQMVDWLRLPTSLNGHQSRGSGGRHAVTKKRDRVARGASLSTLGLGVTIGIVQAVPAFRQEVCNEHASLSHARSGMPSSTGMGSSVSK